MDEMLQIQMTALFEKYTQNLPNKIQGIRELWHTFQRKDNIEIHKQLMSKIHSLKGSSGIYGYFELSHSLRKLEKDLKTHAELTQYPEKYQQITNEIDRLEETITIDSALKSFLLLNEK